MNPKAVSQLGAMRQGRNFSPQARKISLSSPADGAASTKGSQAKGLRRVLYAAIGVTFVALAAVGVVLPGLPTTPFLLLACYFLSRSSEKLHGALLANSVFGPILRDWQTHRGVTQRTKKQAKLMICFAIVFLTFSGLPLAWFGVLVLLTFCGLIVVHRLPEISTAVGSAT